MWGLDCARYRKSTTSPSTHPTLSPPAGLSTDRCAHHIWHHWIRQTRVRVRQGLQPGSLQHVKMWPHQPALAFWSGWSSKALTPLPKPPPSSLSTFSWCCHGLRITELQPSLSPGLGTEGRLPYFGHWSLVISELWSGRKGEWSNCQKKAGTSCTSCTRYQVPAVPCTSSTSFWSCQEIEK